MDTLFGLPAHPLLVHIPVVMVPLAAVGAVVVVVSKKLRHSIGWLVALFAIVGGFGAAAAANAGEGLRDRVPRTANMHHHAQLGETARNFSLLFMLVVVGFVAIDWWLNRSTEGTARPSWLLKWGIPAAMVATVLTAGAAMWTIIDAGHSGAKATWSRTGNGGTVSDTIAAGHGGDDNG